MVRLEEETGDLGPLVLGLRDLGLRGGVGKDVPILRGVAGRVGLGRGMRSGQVGLPVRRLRLRRLLLALRMRSGPWLPGRGLRLKLRSTGVRRD